MFVYILPLWKANTQNTLHSCAMHFTYPCTEILLKPSPPKAGTKSYFFRSVLIFTQNMHIIYSPVPALNLYYTTHFQGLRQRTHFQEHCMWVMKAWKFDHTCIYTYIYIYISYSKCTSGQNKFPQISTDTINMFSPSLCPGFGQACHKVRWSLPAPGFRLERVLNMVTYQIKMNWSLGKNIWVLDEMERERQTLQVSC